MGRFVLWRQQAQLIQSAVAYAAASLITVALHEFGHGLAARLYGFHPTVYGLHEEDLATSPARMAVISTAGPFVSLVLGLIFLAILKRLRGQVLPATSRSGLGCWASQSSSAT